jgi:Flp pilus assembly pilin Flp
MTFLPIIVRGILTSSRMRLALSRVRKDARGQDLIEYALLAGFLATTAAAIFPQVTYYLQYVMCEVTLYLAMAASTDGTTVDPSVGTACIAVFG